jgi:hypothetical protein
MTFQCKSKRRFIKCQNTPVASTEDNAPITQSAHQSAKQVMTEQIKGRNRAVLQQFASGFGSWANRLWTGTLDFHAKNIRTLASAAPRSDRVAVGFGELVRSNASCSRRL